MQQFLLLSRASSDGQSVGFHASVQVQQPVHVCQQGPLRMVGRDIEATLHHNNSGLTNSSAPGLEPGTHYTTSELILLGYRSIFKKYHTKTPRDKIGEISTTTCQWVTIHLLDTMCEMNGMCRETVVRK